MHTNFLTTCSDLFFNDSKLPNLIFLMRFYNYEFGKAVIFKNIIHCASL